MNGSTVVIAGESSSNAMGNGSRGYTILPVSALVTLTQSTTLSLSVASTVASIIKATPGDNNTGTIGKASSLRAIKIK